MVTMGRALIADPDLPAKLAAGRDADIIPCVGCNEGCNGRLAQRRPMECAVNPRTGREGVMPAMTRGAERPPARPAKRVIVVGGGPAGMEAALGAAGSVMKSRCMNAAGNSAACSTRPPCPRTRKC